MSLPIIQNDATWELPPRGDKVFHIRISRNTLLALVFSLFLHLLLLWIFAPKLFSMGAPIKEAPPFEISLGPPQEKEVAAQQPILEPLPAQLPTEATSKSPSKTKPIKSRPPKQIKPTPAPLETPVEVAKKSELTVPKPLKKDLPKEVVKEASPDPLPGEDMQAYIVRQKAAKLAAQGASKQDVAEVLASNNTQSAGEKRDAKLKENLKFDGTNGIFQIREMGLHRAQFSFKGWKNNINSARLEVIDVDVPDGSDGKHEVMTKMIEIIRREYTGDFQWESQRLGRVITLSARVEDTAALESFMISEFFGAGSRVR